MMVVSGGKKTPNSNNFKLKMPHSEYDTVVLIVKETS